MKYVTVPVGDLEVVMEAAENLANYGESLRGLGAPSKNHAIRAACRNLRQALESPEPTETGELLPCPFCGARGVSLMFPGKHLVSCDITNCVRGPARAKAQEAIDAWNSIPRLTTALDDGGERPEGVPEFLVLPECIAKEHAFLGAIGVTTGTLRYRFDSILKEGGE